MDLTSIVAQDVFQRKLDAIFLSVPGVTGTADDMQKKYTDLESRQDAVQTSTSFLLWTPVEC